MFIINYKHDYFKKDKKKHTTIRGYSWSKSKKVKIGDLVKESFPSQTNISKVTHIEVIQLENISLGILKDDGEYPGFTITSHEDFCRLINSFIPKFSVQTAPSSWKTIIFLEIQKTNPN